MGGSTLTQSQTITLPPPETQSFGPGLVGAVTVLLVLAGLALLLSRRRKQLPRRLEVLESLALSPRRSLFLARVENQMLVLGVSEAGVQLLATLPHSAAPAVDDGFAQLLEQSEAEQALRLRLGQAAKEASS